MKSRLTASSSGKPGGEGARTHVQVLANSVVASLLILLHAKRLKLHEDDRDGLCATLGSEKCGFIALADPLVAGIVA